MKRVLFVVFAFLYSVHGYSQFNTIRPETTRKQIQPTVAANENTSNNVSIAHIPESTKDETAKIKLLKLRKYLALPVDTIITTSSYGWRNDPFTGKEKFHKGIDLATDYNYVYSVMPGKVINAGKDKLLGNFIEIEHGDFKTIYGHLYQNLVDIKQAVEAGQPIGISGSTGRSTGEHLHFQMLFDGQTIDPKPILNFIQSIADWTKGEFSDIITSEIKKAKQ
ncbi:M23 family metallopeptidase [Parabacteroides sp. PF5-9]|uniref:M23 family metallopeptidase n=1 Tax=Parabacteroides sp. PF5-9 TaxID=1742404 RepID=UPI002474770D|nr:M23 family metallopeptidase [Parabacteroides sp. PF5-9]MDH6358972.1 murein DD-endopeptidase MepM/ murein hydrolase activator NlpD [Parabacteroides sp. PF5-9]